MAYTSCMSTPRLHTTPAVGVRIAFAVMLGLAAAMGVGRFVFTPLFPIMVAQAGMTPSQGAYLATANYAGYLLGAGALSLAPSLNTRRVATIAGILLVSSEVGMLVTTDVVVWSALRLVAGVSSAVLFVSGVTALQTTRVPRWGRALGFGGVGFGIALSGLGVLAASQILDWKGLWLASAILTGALMVPLLAAPHPRWSGQIAETSPAAQRAQKSSNAPQRAWLLLLVIYFLEGLGYIIIGTFIVDSVGGAESAGGPLVWAVVGVTTLFSPLFWMRGAARFGQAKILATTLTVQAIGVAAPGFLDGPLWAFLGAFFFGATFIPIAMLAMSLGAHLGTESSAATLTTWYGVGQILGPLVVVPFIADGYNNAFQISALVLAFAAGLMWLLVRMIRGTSAEVL